MMASQPMRRLPSTGPVWKARPGCDTTGLYRDRLAPIRSRLKIRDKLVLLDTFAVPSPLATPL
jgi:hypothetical protein